MPPPPSPPLPRRTEFFSIFVVGLNTSTTWPPSNPNSDREVWVLLCMEKPWTLTSKQYTSIIHIKRIWWMTSWDSGLPQWSWKILCDVSNNLWWRILLKHIKFVNSAGVVHYPAKLYPPQIWRMLHTAAPVHWKYPVPGRSVNRERAGERAVPTHDLQCTVSVLRKRVVQCNTA